MNTNDDDLFEGEPESGPASVASEAATTTMRRVLDGLNLEYDYDAEDDIISLRVQLETFEAAMFLFGENDDMATLMVRVPVRVPEAVRPAVGEFLHRLNYAGRRKFWEMDYNDGEVRLRATTDTIDAPLSSMMFQAMSQAVLEIADRTFPYLNAVITRSMKPDFAADQAIAALSANAGEEPGE
ncbi:MAG: YbjN domain-containing protein [Terrimicrobiaceae bacterium]|nr:YbjN domain-containing protein [Terrimicrobiaceae bacterium]